MASTMCRPGMTLRTGASAGTPAAGRRQGPAPGGGRWARKSEDAADALPCSPACLRSPPGRRCCCLVETDPLPVPPGPVPAASAPPAHRVAHTRSLSLPPALLPSQAPSGQRPSRGGCWS
jgi:hypothetical protein